MNDRWSELAEECWDERIDGYHFDQEMFAELIVRKCMEVSLKYSHRDDDMGAIIARQIKQYFGIEE